MAREADDPRLRAEEAQLARRAADGDGAAFASLYDRYEQRIYTFCHRLVGSEHDAADATQDAFVKVLQRLPRLGDRELNFGAYLFTAARNASYDVIGKRKRADTVDEIPEYGSQPVYGEMGDRLDLDPEGAALLGSLQEQVRAANARLPERQREVLALRELEELSYDEIAAMMGMNRNAVAQLISRARIKLRDELRGSALAAVAAATPDDERAAALIAERMDGELDDDADREWLEDYLRENERGRAMVECMLEAGTSYRAWLPIVPAVWLRDVAMAKAAESVGADWAEQIEAGRTGEAPGEGAGPHGDAGGASGTGAGAASAAGDVAATAGGRRRAALAGAVTGIVLLLVLGSQLVLGGGGTPQSAGVATTAPTAPSRAATVAGGALADTTGASTKTTSSKKKRQSSANRDVGAQSVVVTSADGTTTVVRNTSAPKRTSKGTSQKQASSGGSQGSGVESADGSGSGKQGAGTTSTPAPAPSPSPTPTPAPTPEPTPDPQPAPQPPPETTPAPTRPTSPPPTTPCRPSPLRPC